MLKMLHIATALCMMVTGRTAAAEGSRKRPSLLTPEVQQATEIAIQACQQAKTTGRPVAQLAARGFQPWRGGYRIRVDNPHIFAGDSSVSVSVDRRGDCRVRVVPMARRDIGLLQHTTARALAGRPLAAEVVFIGVRDGFEVALK